MFFFCILYILLNKKELKLIFYNLNISNLAKLKILCQTFQRIIIKTKNKLLDEIFQIIHIHIFLVLYTSAHILLTMIQIDKYILIKRMIPRVQLPIGEP